MKPAKFVFLKMAAIFKKIIALIVAHFHQLSTNLDPIKDVHSQREITQSKAVLKKYKFVPFKINLAYFIPFILLFGIELDSFSIWAQHGFVYNATGMANLCAHKFFPKKLWLQSTVLINMGMLMAIFNLARLQFDPLFKPKYTMFAIKNSESYSTKIICNGKGLYLS